MSSLRVRPYESRDREAVRALCWRTGYMGEPLDFLYRDRDSWVDLFTAYFTDREPESCFVACDASGQVVGYLLGCCDVRREERYRARLALRHLGLRCVWLRPGSAGFWRRYVLDSLRGHHVPPPDTSRHPASLHIDLDAQARGTGVADWLLRAFLALLREREVPGCHADVLADNARMHRFVARHGFEPSGATFRVPGMRTPDGRPVHGQRFAIAFDTRAAAG